MATKKGRITPVNEQYFRSMWEKNCSRIFDHLGMTWEYEPTTFVFDLQKGPRGYVPDFLLTDLKGESLWIEVRGRVYPGAYSKLKHFRNFYPDEFSKLQGILQKGSPAEKLFNKLKIPVYSYYSDLVKQYNHLPGWNK